MVDIDVHVSSHLKEELAWAVRKQKETSCFKCEIIDVHVSSHLKEKLAWAVRKQKETSCFKCEIILYMLLCGP